MKKLLLGLFLPLTLVSLLRALPAGVSNILFTTSQIQFAAGDGITIQEVLATSPNLAVGDTFVVRGTYTLQSQGAAVMSISLSTTQPIGVPNQASAHKEITAGTGTFEMEYTIQFEGTIYIAFTPAAGGSSFGRIYFSGTQNSGGGSTTPTTPATPTTPTINTAGLASVPFETFKAQFASGDSITIQEVLSSSPNLAAGDTVRVRGVYTLQSALSALLAINLTVNVPGVTVQTSPSSNVTISGGSGTFDLAYQLDQPGSLHVTFYSTSSGSSFGGVYFAAPGTSGNSSSSTNPALVSPPTNTGLLGNLSIRSLVGPGAGALTAGVTVTDRERYVLIRAVGPTLSQFGVGGVLAKPVLTVYDTKGNLVASTGSWSANSTAQQRAGLALLSSSVGAFPLATGSDDAVVNLRLVPGGYTITVSTGDGQPGTALLEVYASSTFTLPP